MSGTAPTRSSARATRSSAPTSSPPAATSRWGTPGTTWTSPRSAARRNGRTCRRGTRRPRRTSGGTTTTPTAIERSSSALVAPAELPVVDLHAPIQPGPRVGRAGPHGLHVGAAPELNQQRAAHPPGAVVGQQGPVQDDPVAAAGLVQPAPLRHLHGLAGRLHARLAATDDQKALVIAWLGGVVPHRAAQCVAPA